MNLISLPHFKYPKVDGEIFKRTLEGFRNELQIQHLMKGTNLRHKV